MSQEEAKQTRKRRSVEELKAHYQEKLRGLEENEKREVIRLLAGVADDLQKASTYKCCPREIAATISQTKTILKTLGVP